MTACRLHCSVWNCQLRSIRHNMNSALIIMGENWITEMRRKSKLNSQRHSLARITLRTWAKHLLTSHNAARGSHVTWRHRPAVNYRYSIRWDWLASASRTDNEQREFVHVEAWLLGVVLQWRTASPLTLIWWCLMILSN